jgi:hypothetical protein
MPIILAIWEAEIRRIAVRGQLGQIVYETSSFKNNQSKMDWRVAQAVDCLFCMCKALSSTPNTTKKDSSFSEIGIHLVRMAQI